MLIIHKKPFNMGALLGVSFFMVLFLIFSPLFGGKNGLEYSDDLFNKLSKGSSYFIPKLTEEVKKFSGKNIGVTLKLDKPEVVEKTAKVLMVAGAQVGVQGSEVRIGADLGKMLSVVIKDSDAMYHNDAQKVAAAYGLEATEVMSLWWGVLTKMDKELKKDKKVEESNVVSEVTKKGIEPAFNFFGIEAQRVSDKAGTMIGLLVFYVLYTMWWGYAIFYMFDGIGLSMKKAKVKKEV
ncbi:MAG TPA: hypothetical protein PLM79_07965 [Syntrophobacteraceae bacterium]|nr:hypothetical protein [Syntrophobacteraceae bacterium]